MESPKYDYIEMPPIGGSPDGVELVAAHWFVPGPSSSHRSPMYVMFLLVSGERRAIAVSANRHGHWFSHEYRGVWSEESRTFEARPVTTYEPGRFDVLLDMIDPIEQWIDNNRLPVTRRV